MTEDERAELAKQIAKEIADVGEGYVLGSGPDAPSIVHGDVTMGSMKVGTYGSVYVATRIAIEDADRRALRLHVMPPAPTDPEGMEVVARGARIAAAWQAAADRGFPDEDRDANLTYDGSLRRDASPTGDPGEHGPYVGATQAKHVPHAVIMHLIAAMEEVGCGAQRTSIEVALGAPRNVVTAKLDKLLRRDWIDGCLCGCRGDFTVLAR